MILCYLSDNLESDYALSFLVEWNHPYREIENLEMKVDIEQNFIQRRCFVAPSLKRGKTLYNIDHMDGILIPHSQLFQSDSMNEIVDVFVNKTALKKDDKLFRIFKVWFFDNSLRLPPSLELCQISETVTKICFTKREEINLNVKKMKLCGEKMDYHLEERLRSYFRPNPMFYLYPLEFWTIDDNETNLMVIYLSQILNKLIVIPIEAQMKRSKFINLFSKNQHDINEILSDRKIVKELSTFLKQYVFFEHDNFSAEILFVLNHLNDKLQKQRITNF
jgi:hypothetical protein